MARKTSAALLAEIVALFPDNNTELITPAAIRTSLSNIVESFTDAYGAMTGTPGVIVALTAAVIKLAVFDTVQATSPFVTPSAANDNFVVSDAGLFQFNFSATVAGPNNAVTRFVVRVNGVETGWTFQVTMQGTGSTGEATFSGVLSGVPAGATIDMGVSSLSGAQSPTVSQSIFVVNDIQQ